MYINEKYLKNFANFKKAFTLTEGTSYCNLLPKMVKFGFTLAEVLIVIGVIGVVAALTIPTLIKNHQKKVWVNQLKTSIVKIQDGFRLAMAEDGVDDLGETELWATLPEDDWFGTGGTYNEGKDFIDRLHQYIKISSVQDSDFSYDVHYLAYKNNNDYDPLDGAITLLNGTMITDFYFYSSGYTNSHNTNDNARTNGGSIWKIYGYFAIDVNGTKGPNQFGRDVFKFDIAQNGLLYPSAGKDYAIYYGATLENYNSSQNYWKSSSSHVRTCDIATSMGFGCAARIIEEGWKMNY